MEVSRWKNISAANWVHERIFEQRNAAVIVRENELYFWYTVVQHMFFFALILPSYYMAINWKSVTSNSTGNSGINVKCSICWK